MSHKYSIYLKSNIHETYCLRFTDINKGSEPESFIKFTSAHSTKLFKVPHVNRSIIKVNYHTSRYIQNTNQNLKSSKIQRSISEIKLNVLYRISKLFPPSHGSPEIRTLVALNRFGPLLHLNLLFLYRLAKIYKAYTTVFLVVFMTLLIVYGTFFDPKFVDKFSSSPHKYWLENSLEPMLLSPFVHFSYFHFALISGWFITLSSIIELGAGPLILLSVILSSGMAGSFSNLIYSPSFEISFEGAEQGIFPSIAGLSGFYWASRFHTSHKLFNSSPQNIPQFLSYSLSHQRLKYFLFRTIQQRKLPFILMGFYALTDLMEFHSNTRSTFAGLITGICMGSAYSIVSGPLPLVLAATSGVGVGIAGLLYYLGESPTWNPRYQLHRFASYWSNKNYSAAHTWYIKYYKAKAKESKENLTQWDHLFGFLIQMACGNPQLWDTTRNNLPPINHFVHEEVLQLMLWEMVGNTPILNRLYHNELDIIWNLNSREKITLNPIVASIAMFHAKYFSHESLEALKSYEHCIYDAPPWILNSHNALKLYVSCDRLRVLSDQEKIKTLHLLAPKYPLFPSFVLKQNSKNI